MYRSIKRVIDFTAALILSAAVVLPVSVIAVVVRWENSPVLFKQERTGKDGKPFTIYKFRTMLNEIGRASCRERV